MIARLREFIALRVGIWALRALFGECETYIWDDFPGEGMTCLGCDATKIIRAMRDILHDDLRST